MVLHHIANGACLIVKTSSALYAEIFGHGDLDAFDIVAVPEGFREGVGEAEGEQVVYWPLAKVVVNSKDVRLVEDAEQNLVQLPRARVVMPKRLLNNNARPI